MVDVVWLAPSGMDQIMLQHLLRNEIWNPVGAYDLRHVDSFDDVLREDIILVLPGAYHKVEDINAAIKNYRSVLIMIVSDENNLFPVEDLKHPNMKLWIQTPRVGRDYGDARFFGVGYGEARRYHNEAFDVDTDVFVSGQNTHARREKVFALLEKHLEGNKYSYLINRTNGFTQGMRPWQYFDYMQNTKIAPAPSGVVSPDSFRVYEALECGVIPIADDLSPAYKSKGYWALLFPDTPMPILGDNNIGGIIDTELANFAQRRNQIFAWWQQQKRKYAYDLVEDLDYLTMRNQRAQIVRPSLKDRITVVIPVSPWEEHPATKILEETIRNVQAQLPGVEVIVTFDGVRPEQMDRNDDYQEFIIRMLHKFTREYTNVLPIVMKDHAHQSGMAREALKHVKTRSILYNEGDSPLYADRHIAWDQLLKDIEWGDANIIRLYNKETIPPEHEYLMFHEFDVPKLGLIATAQWSQQPHIAEANLYREMLDLSTGYFTKDAKCFIEEKMYYIIVSESRNGQWGKWRMFIYKPDNEPRSYHLDGRKGGPNFYEKQVF